jgi:hypothetical protein
LGGLVPPFFLYLYFTRGVAGSCRTGALATEFPRDFEEEALEKRQREQVRRQKRMKKQERKDQRAIAKRNPREGEAGAADGPGGDDLAGIVPGPQPGQIP